MVDRLEQRYTGQVTFYVYSEADKNAEHGSFAARQKIQSVPTIVLVSEKGVELTRWVGSVPEAQIAGELDEALAPH